tara:strand:+ start:43 stop:720 length:678 start_codon:yes stop_codon:yes gene_type:complete
MVQKSRGGKKSRSVVSGRKRKNEMKHNRKDNYKKKKEKTIECCVCYEEVPDRSDNVVMCGKTKHPLCGACKMKMLGTGSECPMCRSHPIPEPKSQEVKMRIKKQGVNEEKEPKRISVKGFDCLDGIYVEVGKDKNKMSIYKMEDDSPDYEWYIYRSDMGDWVLNTVYDPKDKVIAGYSVKIPMKHGEKIKRVNYSGKFLGSSDWRVPSKNDDGGWVITTVQILKV